MALISAIQSPTDIANLALAHCGSSNPIGDLITERSQEARSCRLFYDVARQQVLRAIPWPFAKKFANLQLVTNFTAQNVPATMEWWYSYRYPSDCLHFLRIVSQRLNNDTRDTRVPYAIAADNYGLLIYANWPSPQNPVINPQCEYTFDNQNIAQYPEDFILCLSYRIAAYIAGLVTGGDPYQKGPAALQNYSMELAKSSGQSLNEEQRPMEPESEFIRARDYDSNSNSGVNWSPIATGFSVV